MRNLQIDRQIIYYALPTGKRTKQMDEFGNYTGEVVPEYSTPVRYDRLYGPTPSGMYRLEPFGITSTNAVLLATHDMDCPIVETARLWINACPYDKDGNLTHHTHLVKRILPSLRAIRIEAEVANA